MFEFVNNYFKICYFQPFCDGAHKDHPKKIKPVHFSPPKDGKFLLCRCKQTNNRPYCDLTHIKTCMSFYFLNLILYLALVLPSIFHALTYFYVYYDNQYNQHICSFFCETSTLCYELYFL